MGMLPNFFSLQSLIIALMLLVLSLQDTSCTTISKKTNNKKKSSAPAKRKRSGSTVIQKAPVGSAGITNTGVGDDRYESGTLVTGETSTTTKMNNTMQLACRLNDLTCIQQKYSVEYIFPTPLMYHTLVVDKKTVGYNEEIKQIMLDLEEENDGCKFNLHGGYRSKDGFLDRPEESIRWLRGQIEHRIRLMLSLSGAGDTPFFIDGWGAVLRGNHGQPVHVHPQSMYAGVYYVAAPQEVANSGEHWGCLMFYDPRPAAEMTQFERGKSLYGSKVEVCPPGNGGLLVLFPSWLMHEVVPMPESYKGPRIGISFNVNHAAYRGRNVPDMA